MATTDAQKATQKRFHRNHPERRKAWQKAWSDANPDKVKAKRERHQLKHRDEILERRRSKGRETRNRSKDYMSAYLRKYYEDNMDKVKARAKLWYETHKDIAKATNNRYRSEHRDEYLANARRYRKDNIDRYKAWCKANKHRLTTIRNRRRAHFAKAAINDLTAEQWLAIQARHDHRCVYCGRRSKGQLSQDHITPISKGGNHTAFNVVPACRPCNSSKGNRQPLCPVQPMLLV